MPGEKIIENTELVTQGLKTDPSINLSDKDLVLSKDGVPDSVSPVSPLVDASSAMKGDGEQITVGEHGGYYLPTNCYNYYYPGFNGGFTQLDDQGYPNAGGGSYTGIQSDNSSLIYYLAGYPHYDYVSSGYIQPYASEALPCNSWDSACAGNVTNKVVNESENVKPVPGRNGSVKSNGFNSSKTTSAPLSKTGTAPLNSKARQFTMSSNFSKPFAQSQLLKPFNKLGSGFQTVDNMNGFNPAGKFSPYSNQNRGVFMPYGAVNYQPNVRLWNGNQNLKPRYNYRSGGENEAFTELTRGPRTDSKSDPSKLAAGDVQPEQILRCDKYNVEDFKCDYENAKFYVIKSYSEDDVHKCIKYDVWSSTPNGNKKLDAAFRDADAKATDAGTKCPVFLFFSVNGSGQFVGVAEMMGQVDFNKNMDFWQLDKWDGFFPVKWHIVKDLPNTLLRHIILENNDNRPVTYSRDTQEIGLKQGLVMLNIFKSYSAKTSLLDDFNFYENREKLLKANRSCEPARQTNGFGNDDIAKNAKGGEKTHDETSKIDGANPIPSLVNLTNNLSLSSQALKSNV